MLQRAQPHLSENRDRSLVPWLILGGVVLLLLIAAGLAMWMRGSSEVDSARATLVPVSEPLATPTALNSIIAPSPLPGATPASTPTRSASPAPTFTRVPSPVPTPTLIKYRVQPGDTLSSIAQHYGVSVDGLMRMNGLKNQTIYIGQTLTIPRP